ncbi:MAG: hypothetical protein H6971_00160 [Gammaproteobacteria bacterium]|nr:hypothetical protein [Gammaproteobacteria bacterium]
MSLSLGTGLVQAGESVQQDEAGWVNISRFKDRVRDGDWSPAIQAAIDYVRPDNGYTRGATVLFPAGRYRIDRPLEIGNNPAHGGLHLLGYGAVLVGGSALDGQPLPSAESGMPLAGVPIVRLKTVPEVEEAAYVIEGLSFDRENGPKGVGIAIPWAEIPKSTSFRSIKVFNQDVGIHILNAWQIYFSDCVFFSNGIGLKIQHQGNNISILNSVFRRNHYHGLVIGPDQGQAASNAQFIAGSIFEANKGYGILLSSNGQTQITGNYFEANGTGIGVMTLWPTTIDTNFFEGYYGQGWRRTPFADNAHIVVDGARHLRLRNNTYNGVQAWFRRKPDGSRWEYLPPVEGPIGVTEHRPAPPLQEPGYEYQERPVTVLITGVFGGRHVFDTVPTLHQDARVETQRIGSDDGLHYFQYQPRTHTFIEKDLLGS